MDKDEKTIKPETHGKPERPPRDYRNIYKWPCNLIESVSRCILNFINHTRSGQLAEKLGKLSVLAAIIIFAFGKGNEAWNASSVAEVRYREEMRNNLQALSSSADKLPLTRQWAFTLLKNFLDSSANPIGESKESKRFYEDAKRSGFSRLDLSDLYLVDEVLDARNLQRAILSQTNLTGANLSNADLSNAVLEKAILIGSCLTKAKLGEVTLAGASLQGADLSGADLTSAIFVLSVTRPDTSFDWLAAQLDAKTKLTGAILKSAKLSHVKFDGVDLSGADLRDTKLTGRAASDSGSYPRLNPTSFKNANLTDAQLQNVDFSQVDLTGAILRNADLTGANLINAIGVTKKQYESAITDSSTKEPREFVP